MKRFPDAARAAGMAMASLKREAEELGLSQEELEGEEEEAEKKKKDRDGSSSSEDDDDDDGGGGGMGLFDDEAGADAPQWEAPSAASRKPLNVEDILRRLSTIAEVGVGRRPDPEWGERVVAYIVPIGEGPSLDEVRSSVGEALGRYAAPREVVLVTSLPRTSIGKLRRSALS